MSSVHNVWSNTQRDEFLRKWKDRNDQAMVYMSNTHDEYNKDRYAQLGQILLDFVKDLVKRNIWPEATDANNNYTKYFEHAQRAAVEEEKQRKESERLRHIQELKDSMPYEAKQIFQYITQLKKEVQTKESEIKYFTEEVRQIQVKIKKDEKEKAKMETRIADDQKIVQTKKSILAEALDNWRSYENHQEWETILSTSHEMHWQSINRLLTLMQHVIEA